MELKTDKKLFLIRSAQNVYDATQYVMKDSVLSPLGVSSASKIEGYLDLVIVSALWRAQETVKHSSLKYKELVISNNCREICNGDISNEIEFDKLSNIRVETNAEIESRLDALAAELKEKLSNDNISSIAILSHRNFIHMFLRRFYPDIDDQFTYFGNCQVAILDISPFYKAT